LASSLHHGKPRTVTFPCGNIDSEMRCSRDILSPQLPRHAAQHSPIKHEYSETCWVSDLNAGAPVPSPNSSWRVGGIRFSPPAGAVRSKVVKGFAPRLSGSPNRAAATVAFEVDEQGNAVNTRVQKTDDEAWAAEALAALSKWRFSPGQKDGLPIPVPGTIEFLRAK
jgi:TonB family protein